MNDRCFCTRVLVCIVDLGILDREMEDLRSLRQTWPDMLLERIVLSVSTFQVGLRVLHRDESPTARAARSNQDNPGKFQSFSGCTGVTGCILFAAPVVTRVSLHRGLYGDINDRLLVGCTDRCFGGHLSATTGASNANQLLVYACTCVEELCASCA